MVCVLYFALTNIHNRHIYEIPWIFRTFYAIESMPFQPRSGIDSGTHRLCLLVAGNAAQRMGLPHALCLCCD